MSDLGVFRGARRAWEKGVAHAAVFARRSLLVAAALAPLGAHAGSFAISQPNAPTDTNQLEAPGMAVPNPLRIRNDSAGPGIVWWRILSDNTSGATLNGASEFSATLAAGAIVGPTLVLGPSEGFVNVEACPAIDDGMGNLSCTDVGLSFFARTATLSRISGDGFRVERGESFPVSVQGLNGGTVDFSSVPVTFAVSGPVIALSPLTTSSDMYNSADLQIQIDPNAADGATIMVTATRTDVPSQPTVSFTFTVNTYVLNKVMPLGDNLPVDANTDVTLEVEALFNNGPPDNEQASRDINWEIVSNPNGSTLNGAGTTATTTVAPTRTTVTLNVGAPNLTATPLIVRATAFEPIFLPAARGAQGAVMTSNVRTVDFILAPRDVLTLTAIAGDGQQASVGDPLPNPLQVEARRNGLGDSGRNVDWSVSPANAVTFAGGASTAQTPTDVNGVSQIAVTSVNAAGPITVTAAHGDDPTVVDTFTLTGTAPVLAFDTPTGDGQFAPVNTAFAQPLRLRTTRNGAGEQNVQINWTVSPANGAQLSDIQTVTDANGFTQITAVAGSTGGPITITATRADDPSTFYAFGLTVVDKRLDKPSTGSGDGQTGVPGSPATDPLVAVATLNGATEPGVTVLWQVTGGDATLGTVTNPTDNNGRSTAQILFGPTASTVTVTATRQDLMSEVETYTLTAVPTRSLEKPSTGSGDGQTGLIGQTMPDRLVVIARNNGVPAPDVDVIWTVQGSGSVTPTRSTTRADGSTEVTFTFGPSPGTVTVTAARADDPSATSTFVLTSTAINQPPSGTLEKPEGSGDRTSAPVGTEVELLVRALFGASPQAEVQIQWELLSGSAQIGPERTLTDGTGIARTRVTLGPSTGTVQVRAVRLDTGAAQTYQLTATGAATGAQLSIVDGNNQSGAPGSTASPLRVRLTDGDVAVPDAAISWQIVSGDATLSADSSTTDAQGIAQVGLTFGSQVGDIQVRASHGNATALFLLRTTTPGLSLRLVSGSRQSGPIGTRADQPIVVQVTDGLGNPVENQLIDWTVVSGSASFDLPQTQSGADGNSTQGLRFGSTAGAIRLRATLPSLVPEVFVEVEATSFVPALTIVSGNNQTGQAGAELPQDLVVAIAAPASQAKALSGVTIRWTVTAGGGSLAAATTTTGSDGRTSNRLTLGPQPGQQTVTASLDGGATVTFTATAQGEAGPLTIVSGNNQTLPTQSNSAPLVVELKTTNGVPVSGASLLWTVQNAEVQSVRTTTGVDGRSSNVAQVLLPGAARVTVQVEGGSGASGNAVDFILNGGVANIPQLNQPEETVGNAIDNACPALVALANPTPAQADLRARCLELVNNAGDHPDQVDTALTELREDVALAQANAALVTASTQFDNLKTRIAALRSGASGADFGGLALANGTGTLPLSFLPSAVVQESDPAEGGSGAEVGADFSRWGFFASGIIGRGEYDGGSATPDYDFDTNGITAGVDYRVNDQWIVGASLGYNQQDTELNGQQGGIDTDGWSVSGYTTWYQENNWYVDGVLTFGSNDYDLTRSIVYSIVASGGGTTQVNQVAEASTGGDTLSVALSFGRDFQKGAWNFGPYMRGTYTRVEFDAYEEELGAGPGSGLGLAVDARELKSMTAVLGGKVTYAISRDWGILMPHAQLEWEHEFKDDPQQIVTRFLHDPTGTAIRVDGDEVDTDYFNIGFGLSALFPGGKSAFFYYEHLAGSEGLSQDNLSIGVRIEF